MSALTTPSRRDRRTRGRVIVIGSASLSLQLVRHLPTPPLSASNLFDALGQITTAEEPIAIVVIESDRLPEGVGSPRRAADAFRRIDPSLRVVLVTPDAHRGGSLDALADGFDDYLRLPLNTEEVRRALVDDEELPAPREAESANVETSPQVVPESDYAEVMELDAERDEVTDHPDSVVSAPESQEHPEKQAVSEPPTEPELRLGDTDLVQAVLANPDRVCELGLKLIIQQTQWTDLRLIENATAESHPHGALVQCREQSAGMLVTDFADGAQLEPWAQWLTQWLTLNKSMSEYRLWAFQDDLTGAWNRRFFRMFMEQTLKTAARHRRAVTLMLFDLDDFKQFNDRFGHEAGDEILRDTVRLLNSVIRKGDRVCRIGGDEFVVVFADPEGPREIGSAHPESIEQIARRFQDQVCAMKFPRLGAEAPGTLSISAGLATYPWDGHDVDSLLNYADQLALESKRRGKNAITFGLRRT